MHRLFILLCFVFLKTVCVLANAGSPWSYFNKPRDTSNFPQFNVGQNTEEKFPGFSQDFNSRHDLLSSPQLETGFVPSFGHFSDHRSAQSSNSFGYSKPLQSSNQHRGTHRNKNIIYHKYPVGQSSSHLNRYHNKGNPQKITHSSSIYKPNFIVGTHLSQLRDDPTYHKVRANIHTNGKRLKIKEKYPNAVNGDVLQKQQNEYFEPQYEKYAIQKEPHYYKKPQEHVINYDKIQQSNRYPLPNYGNIKIHPNAYNPLKSHINQLKKNQHNTFSEGTNDYPENKHEDKLQDDEQEILSGGQDILDAQKNIFDNHNHNFDDKFSSHVKKHHPGAKLLAKPPHEDEDETSNTEGTDFVPIKTYAQVRHTESTQHLPREAAYEDAETFDEVLNAPRLREAVKTTKAQTVYTEEGYEDVAYDHAGHLKHASNQEGYSGYLKGKEDTKGKESKGKGGHKYGSEGKSKHGFDLSKGKKWSLDEGDNEEFNNKDSFSLREGDYVTKNHDLAGAGSNKHVLNKSKQNITEDKVKVAPIKLIDLSKENNKKKHHHKNTEREEINNKNEPHNNQLSLASSPEDQTHNFSPKLKNPPSFDEGVEIFDPNFNFNEGPKHGGNYEAHPTVQNYPKNKDNLKVLLKSKIVNKNKSEPQRYQKLTISPEDDKYNFAQKSKSPPSFDDGVEIFDPNFNFNKGPKHGGNYESHPTVQNYPKNKGNLKVLLKSKGVNKNENIKRDENINGHAKNFNNKEFKGASNENQLYKSNVTNNDEWVGLENIPKKAIQTSEKTDQHPLTSQVEVFKSELISNSPKHGGNYKKSSDSKRRGDQYSELEDLNTSAERLHGGNYKNKHDEEDMEDQESNEEFENVGLEEGLPTSIINNIAFLTSNMTVPIVS